MDEDGQTIGRGDEWRDEKMVKWTKGRIDESMDDQTNIRMDGRIVVWTDGLIENDSMQE